MPSPEGKSPKPSVRSVQPVALPIGVSDFGELVRDGYTFVDKTQLIEDIVGKASKITFLPRPRRFGKTLNLSMLRHFFAADVRGQPTAPLFEGLAISERPSALAHQGKYPVIFLTFKEVKAASFEGCEAALRQILANLYEQYPELPGSPVLNDSRRKQIHTILNKQADIAAMADSVRLLSELLYEHHKQRVVVLLDEYDAPIHAAYTNGFYPKIIEFMRPFMGAALKDNAYVWKAVVTGVLRVAKESLFSDLNNVDVFTVLDDNYSAYFGFTETEVSGLIEATASAPALEPEIKRWYNGYRFGAQVVYNPWSIVKCLKEQGKLLPYWIGTSGDDLLKRLMARADVSFKEGLEQLIQGETVTRSIDPKMVFPDLDGSSTALWSLLLYSGYLTALASKPTGTLVECELTIPNLEIRQFYGDTIKTWFTGSLDPGWYTRLLRSLANGDADEFSQVLRQYLLRSASYFDPQGQDPEKFYHGIVLGMMVGLKDSHDIRSNRESGFGRYDMALIPMMGSGYETGIVLEFKQVADSTDLKAAADHALAQIDARRYRTELERPPVKKILALGMAFAGKEMALSSRVGMPH